MTEKARVVLEKTALFGFGKAKGLVSGVAKKLPGAQSSSKLTTLIKTDPAGLSQNAGSIAKGLQANPGRAGNYLGATMGKLGEKQ